MTATVTAILVPFPFPPDDGPGCGRCRHRQGAHCQACKACHGAVSPSRGRCRCSRYQEASDADE